jgi:hypothetical protein
MIVFLLTTSILALVAITFISGFRAAQGRRT